MSKRGHKNLTTEWTQTRRKQPISEKDELIAAVHGVPLSKADIGLIVGDSHSNATLASPETTSLSSSKDAIVHDDETFRASIRDSQAKSSGEEDDNNSLKSSKSRRARRKAHRQALRRLKSDTEVSEDEEDEKEVANGGEASLSASTSSSSSKGDSSDKPLSVPEVKPPQDVGKVASNEDNFKVTAKPFVPSGLSYTQIVKKIHDDFVYPSYNFVHTPQPHPGQHGLPHPHHHNPVHQQQQQQHQQHHHHQQYHQHHAQPVYKNPNEYRNWPSNNKKELDHSQFELDISRILSGEDKMTALMVKNIPNRYTQEMILEAICEKHRGLYDFFYLPIDFKNKCNVGYFFINFIDPMSIPSFYMEFNQKRWQKFNSSKVCKITYARIQGKAAFIEHFRNSSLLSEDTKCQPLIFHSHGPMRGLPEPFPDPRVNLRVSKGSVKTQQ